MFPLAFFLPFFEWRNLQNFWSRKKNFKVPWGGGGGGGRKKRLHWHSISGLGRRELSFWPGIAPAKKSLKSFHFFVPLQQMPFSLFLSLSLFMSDKRSLLSPVLLQLEAAPQVYVQYISQREKKREEEKLKQADKNGNCTKIFLRRKMEEVSFSCHFIQYSQYSMMAYAIINILR